MVRRSGRIPVTPGGTQSKASASRLRPGRDADGGWWVVGQVQPRGLACRALGEPHIDAVLFADIDQPPGGEQSIPDGSAACIADAGELVLELAPADARAP